MFVWFWLVMAVVIAIIVALDRLTEPDYKKTPMFLALEVPLTYYGRVAIGKIEQGDRQGLRATLENLKSSTGISSYLFHNDRVEGRGSPASRSVAALAAEAKRTGRSAFSFSHDKVLAAIDISRNRDWKYILVGVLPGESLNSTKQESLFLLPRLGIALVISLLACYLLARYLTTPIVRLGAAARQLASGDPGVAISLRVGKRWDEIGDLAHDFDLMAERIRLLLTSQQKLLGAISHELRSPLARLNVALELARRQSPPAAAKFLDRIGGEAERLNEMIGYLLTLTRLESEVTRAEKRPVDLDRLVRDVASDADFEARGCTRSVQVVEAESCLVAGIEDVLSSAIENILRNAVRSTEEGTTVEVSLRCFPDNDARYVLIRIRDHGPGVPEEALGHLFQPFYRVEQARDRETGGVGLGLALTERAVLLHDGKVRASNSPDGGLVVEVVLGPVINEIDEAKKLRDEPNRAA